MINRNLITSLSLALIGLSLISTMDSGIAIATDVSVTFAVKASPDKPTAVADQPESKPLSVAPQSSSTAITFPPDRPSWVDQSPDMSADLHRWPVVSTPASTAELSRQALSAQLRAAAETYIETILSETDAASIIPLDDAWIESHLSADHQYEGEVFAGDEVMYESAAQLLFESADRQWIEARWNSHQVAGRLVNLAILTFLGGTILFVATAGMSIVVRRAERRVTQSLDQ